MKTQTLRDPYNPTEATHELMRMLEDACGRKLKWTTQQVILLYVNVQILCYNHPPLYVDLQAIVNDDDDYNGYYKGDHWKMVQKIFTKVLA
jgi:hypothetical protein